MLKVQDALLELQVKSYNQIQEETAWKWASRAIAAFQIMLDSEGHLKHIRHSMANSYFSEATEHAAESGDAQLVQQIIDTVTPVQQLADAHMAELLKETK